MVSDLPDDVTRVTKPHGIEQVSVGFNTSGSEKRFIKRFLRKEKTQ